MPHPLNANVQGRGAGKRRLLWSAIIASKSALCSRQTELAADGLLEAIEVDGWTPPRTKMQMSRSHFARMMRQQEDVEHRYTASGRLLFTCGCEECSAE